MGQPVVFISYSHKDEREKDKLLTHLGVLHHQGLINLWGDDQIGPGADWKEKISQAMTQAKVAILLVTANFLTSEFILSEEIPALLKRHESEGLIVFPVIAKPCAWQQVDWLAKMNVRPKNGKAIWSGWRPRVDEDLANIAKEVSAIVKLNPHMASTVSRDHTKSELRVCFISSEYFPHEIGGLGIHVTQLSKALGRYLDVDIVLPTSSDKSGYRSPNPNVHLHTLANSQPSYTDPTSWLSFANHAADRIKLIARDFRPNVIHCHDWVTVLAGVKCRWHLKIPLVFHLHLPNRAELCASVENFGLVCADLITVNSNIMFEELRNRDLPLKRVEVIRNGVDPETFRPCEDWPISDGYILFVGRLVEQKGVEYLLRALAFVKEKFPHIRLKIVGDGSLKLKLENLCANLMLLDHVEFLGHIKEQELVSYYQKASVVVVPSIYEPFGMTALEALSCQRPVLASRVGGLEEIIEHHRTGFLAEPEDYLDLAQWLMALLSSSDLRNSLGRAGRENVLNDDRYTWPKIAQQFIQLYDELQRNPLEKNLSPEAWKFKEQVISIAQKLDTKDNVLNELFGWMKLL